MLDLHLEVKPQTAEKLKRVLELHTNQETFAQNIIAYQIAELKKAILNLRLDLKTFEKRHNRTSADFYDEFSKGATGDSEEYMLWAGLYELLAENEERLTSLQ